jgi:hypothetical protein
MVERMSDGSATVQPVPIPLDCIDGFNEAYYGRPERLLEPGARQACSAWSFVDQETTRQYTDKLRQDLESGAWGEHHSSLR